MSFNPPPLPPMQPTWGQFQVWWQAVVGSLQGELGALAAAQAAQATANTAVTNAAAAQTTANTGVTNAATAQTTADTVKRDDAISTSWTSPGTILTGRDAGASASIIIAGHTRYYSDTNSVSVTGATLTGKSYSTVYYVYYDQTSRAGGAVSYQATTNANTALPGKAAGRHYCGKVTTPAAAAADTTGDVNPPGGGGGIGGGEVP
jgi:trimeric autotransporter adhesin